MKAAISRKSWFERHPKKTLLFILVPVVFGLALLAEKILTMRLTPVAYRVGVKRSIKLREFEPLSTQVVFALEPEGHDPGGQLPQGVALRIDENGFIMPSKVHAHPDRTLVFLGGSTTECCSVPEDKRFPYLTGRFLEEKTKLKVNSYNSGRSGNDTLHSLNVLLNKVIPLKPDIVVMMHNINDLTILMYEKTYWTKNPYRGPIEAEPPSFKTAVKYLQEAGYLIRDLTFPNLYRQIKHHLPFGLGVPSKKDEFKKVRGQKITLNTADLVRQFSLNLETFIDICRIRKITPVLMTMPSRLKDHPDPYVQQHTKKLEDLQGITYQQFKGAFDRLNETVREVGARDRVTVIDLAAQVPQEEEFLMDLVHYTDTGSALVAKLVSESLQPLIQAEGGAQKQPDLNRTN
jgi:lysophospholipase L1-like esterase